MDSQPKVFDIEIKMLGGQGTCTAGHSEGETFLVRGDSERFTADGLCIHALYSMISKIIAMRYGASFPWAKDNPDVVTHACPDASNPHTFQLRRIRG
ncbi:MAG: TIGR04076 family protein [Candidatus Bipolaricaulota bacterium]